jgi:hypothetical protein
VAEVGYLDYTNGFKQILAKPYVYQRLPNSRVWCQYDLSSLGPGFLFGALTGFKSDPAAALMNLEKSGDYEDKGDEKRFGVETTRYAGHVDLDQLGKRIADPARRKLLREFAADNDNELPVQVWLGKDELPRRIATSFSVDTVAVRASFDFSRFGVSVKTKQPPQSETAEGGTPGCPSL